MVKLKKAFAWLFGNFSSSLIYYWMPAVVIQDFLNTDEPDGWDYGFAIFFCIAFTFSLVSEIVSYQ
tara:strand:+ start:715 stop:912 length:198 start_codon:yes stop_codon:yes gene_type:complete